MWALLDRLRTDARANVATLFAAVAPILIGVAALAVDEASLHLEKRRLQSAADLAAIHAAADPANAAARVERALADAGYDPLPQTVLVQTGFYSADPDLAPAERFAADARPANAARVTLRQPGRVHFAAILGLQAPSIGVSATASASPMAAWSIGSRLASLNDGLLNAILGSILGGDISLSLMDYNGILGLDIGLLDFLDALALELDLTAGTYSDLLDAKVSLGDIGLALASAAGNNAVLLELAGLVDDSITVDMARLIVADGLANLAIGTSAAVQASVDALGLLTAAALVGDGERHVKLDLGLSIPGLTGIDVDLVIGEPPQGGWFTLSGEGAYLRTAQTRLRLDISLLKNDSGLGLLTVRVPIYAELAPAEAHLASLTCPPGRPDLGRATVAARPGVLRLAVGHTAQSSFQDTRRPLAIEKTTILSLLGGLVRVTAYADVSMSQINPVPLYFTAADAATGKVQTARTTTPLTGLTTSLLSNLELDIEILGLNLLGGLLSGLLGTVSALIAPVIGVLDHVLVAILDVLGIGIGEVDVALHGFDCRNAALVQ